MVLLIQWSEFSRSSLLDFFLFLLLVPPYSLHLQSNALTGKEIVQDNKHTHMYGRMHVCMYIYGDEEYLGFPDLWSGQKPWWNWYLTSGGPSWPNTLSSPPRWSLWIFSDLVRSVQMLKREWDAERNGKLPNLFIPIKTATWFLSLQWKASFWAELQTWFLSLQWKTCPRAEHSDDDDD